MKRQNFLNTREKDHRRAILARIRGTQDLSRIRRLTDQYHQNDLAGALPYLSFEERARLHSALGDEIMADVVSYLEYAGDYLASLRTEQAVAILRHMDTEEALDALNTMDTEARTQLLALMDDKTFRRRLEALTAYDDNQFGSRMSSRFIAVKRGFTVKSAMKTLIGEAAQTDNITTLFVTEADGTLYGAIDLKELIVARSEDDPEGLICTAFPYVLDTEDIAESIERLRGYSEDLIPVLSAQSGRLIGVITAQDITEMVDDRLGDDYAKLAALSEEEEKDEPLGASMRKRIPWLVALLFMGLAVSAVVGLFEGIVDQLPLIVAFQSLILGMAGNVGTQSLAVTVRALGTSEPLRWRDQLSLIVKETRVALLNGLVIGGASLLTVCLFLGTVGQTPLSLAFPVACCVGAAMCVAMMISGFTGATIPLCLYQLGIDPAVASGPLITTVNDLVAVISYYGLAWVFLLPFGS